MPIKPENREKYPPEWDAIAARIRAREGDACKFCKAPNHTYVVRLGGTAYWAWAPIELAARRGNVSLTRIGHGSDFDERAKLATECALLADQAASWRDGNGEPVDMITIYTLPARRFAHVTEIVLTVAHLDNKLEDHSDENLAALCQRCHLTHDHTMRKQEASVSQLGFSL